MCLNHWMIDVLLLCCIVDGVWGTWSEWSSCLAYCGPGVAKRTRECNNPAPTQDGNMCEPLETVIYKTDTTTRKGKLWHMEYKRCNVRGCAQGHIKWCDMDPCLGGICMYHSGGLNYSCIPGIGYEKLTYSDGTFKQIRGN